MRDMSFFQKPVLPTFCQLNGVNAYQWHTVMKSKVKLYFLIGFLLTCFTIQFQTGNLAQGNKTFFMLNSADHEIFKRSKVYLLKNQHFSGSDKPRMPFFMLLNVKMPTNVGILTFMSRKYFMLS